MTHYFYYSIVPVSLLCLRRSCPPPVIPHIVASIHDTKISSRIKTFKNVVMTTFKRQQV